MLEGTTADVSIDGWWMERGEAKWQMIKVSISIYMNRIIQKKSS